MPVCTMCRPQRSRATAPARSSKVTGKFMRADLWECLDSRKLMGSSARKTGRGPPGWKIEPNPASLWPTKRNPRCPEAPPKP
jgi:hypothetical protein